MIRIALTGGIACGKSLVAKVVFADPKARADLEARIHPVVKERIGEC